MRSVLKGLGWSISLVRSNDLQLGQVRETTKHPTERDIGRLEVAHIVHTATLKVLKLKLNPSNPSREKVETVGERRLHIPLQPFVRSAAFVKVGSLPPFDRLQHVHTIGAQPSARTAHSSRSPVGQDAAARPVEAAIRRACKPRDGCRSAVRTKRTSNCSGSTSALTNRPSI